MCGLAGFVDKRKSLSRDQAADLGRRMLSAIEHRGRDADGLYQNGNVLLGHTRLRIIDVAQRSDQPFFSVNSNTVLTFNGELYNHQELRNSLSNSFAYRTESDTETFLYQFMQDGRAFTAKLRGMFAFAIFEAARERLTLGIDHFGIKPLYYLDNDDWFAWSSEAKALFVLPRVVPNCDPHGIQEFLSYRSLSGPTTLFAGVSRLLPGQILTYDVRAATTTKSQYWAPSIAHDRPNCSNDEVWECLRDSVREQVIADVPVGLQLSGGLDSSLVAYCAKTFSDSSSIHSYCIGPPEDDWSEFRYARTVAKSIGTTHHELLVDERTFCDHIFLATYHHDEPINHPNTIALLLLARSARQNIKVLLSGEGADELFSGYRRYVPIVSSTLSEQALLESNRFNSPDLVSSVLLINEEQVSPARLHLARAVQDQEPAKQLALYDLSFYLPGLLCRQDKMAMASNIENRVPYLDKRLVECALAIPQNQKIKNSATKIVLRNLAKGRIPDSAITRPKRGFGLPISKWLRNRSGLGKVFEDCVIRERRRAFFNYGNVGLFFEQHYKREHDHSEILWPILCLEVWLRTFIDQEWSQVHQSSFH